MLFPIKVSARNRASHAKQPRHLVADFVAVVTLIGFQYGFFKILNPLVQLLQHGNNLMLLRFIGGSYAHIDRKPTLINHQMRRVAFAFVPVDTPATVALGRGKKTRPR